MKRIIRTSIPLGLVMLGALLLRPQDLRGENQRADEDEVGYAEVLAGLDARIRSLEQRTEQDPASWLGHDRVARAYLQRARLSGSLDDYAAAEERLERAFSVAAPGCGPWLTRARLHFSLHRFDRVGADLARAERRIVIDDRTRAEITALRADVAFRQGRIDEAERGFERALELHDDPNGRAQLAILLAESGREEEADRLFADALARLGTGRGHTVAWLHLQRGILDLQANRWDEALSHFRLGDEALRGWWLVEEHVAEIYASTGRTGEALALYRRVIEKTGRPEFFRAVAAIHRAGGREADALRFEREAARRTAALRERFPEVVRDHLDGGRPQEAEPRSEDRGSAFYAGAEATVES